MTATGTAADQDAGTPPPEQGPVQVVVVTGLSGAGKNSAGRVLEDLGFRVYACTGNGPVEIGDLDDVTRIKTDTVRGFNFLAFHPRSRVGPAVLDAAA